jgi:hypothetical protein
MMPMMPMMGHGRTMAGVMVRPVRMITAGVGRNVCCVVVGGDDQYRRDWVLVLAGLVGNPGGYLLYAPLRRWSRSD